MAWSAVGGPAGVASRLRAPKNAESRRLMIGPSIAIWSY
jgi:hypothetical protein